MADSVTSKIGKRLVEEGLLAPEELEQAISVQLGIPKVARVLELVDRGLLEGLSLTFLEKHEVLPAFKDSNAVTVILSDPLDDELLRQLERVFGFRDPVGDRDRRGDPRDAPRQGDAGHHDARRGRPGRAPQRGGRPRTAVPARRRRPVRGDTDLRSALRTCRSRP